MRYPNNSIPNVFMDGGRYKDYIHDAIWMIREGYGDGISYIPYYGYKVIRLVDREAGEILRSLTLKKYANCKMYFTIKFYDSYIDAKGNIIDDFNTEDRIKFGSFYEAKSYIHHLVTELSHNDKSINKEILNRNNPYDLLYRMVTTMFHMHLIPSELSKRFVVVQKVELKKEE